MIMGRLLTVVARRSRLSTQTKAQLTGNIQIWLVMLTVLCFGFFASASMLPADLVITC